MIKSMTGYGKSTKIFSDKKVTFEIKTLNSKQADIHIKLPSSYREKEMDIRAMIAKEIIRGKADASLMIEKNTATVRNHLNSKIAQSYYDEISRVSSETSIPMPSDENLFDLILKFQDVYISEEEDSEITDNEFEEIEQVISESLKELNKFRQKEGNTLEIFFEDRINAIESMLKEIDKYENERIEKIRVRIEEGLKSLGDLADIDKNRMEQEMIFYIEKLDISEEKSRLKSHLDYFLLTMNKESNQGKKLGFITQEIGREINTLGSKSNHSQMQKIVVMMKDELEQIKEQILNIL